MMPDHASRSVEELQRQLRESDPALVFTCADADSIEPFPWGNYCRACRLYIDKDAEALIAHELNAIRIRATRGF